MNLGTEHINICFGQASIALVNSSTVTEITLGIHGFEVTSSGTNHAFAVHSSDVALEWVMAIRAMIVRTASMPHPHPHPHPHPRYISIWF
jgi:hypothetical protein